MKRETKNRTDLSQAIPIRTPFVVHIDTCNVCNFRCKFCTSGDHDLLKSQNRAWGRMTHEMFRKVIDDLARFPDKVKDILFHKNGEPLLHDDIIAMMRYAKEKDVANRLILVTNGSKLTPQLCRDIMSIGIHYIQISVEGVSDADYRRISNVNLDYDKLVGNVAYLYAHKHPDTTLNVKLMDCDLDEAARQKFLADFGKISDTQGIEHPISYTQPELKDTSLGIKPETTHDGYARTYKDVCTLPFYTMNINFNGNVSACSFDWRHGLIMGNVGEESLLDIWNGKRYNDFRILHLQKRRNEHPVCNGCEGVCNLIDNIDDAAEEILKRMPASEACPA